MPIFATALIYATPRAAFRAYVYFRQIAMPPRCLFAALSLRRLRLLRHADDAADATLRFSPLIQRAPRLLLLICCRRCAIAFTLIAIA